LTFRPSWSTAISSFGRPARPAVRWSVPAIRRSCALEPKLNRWMITPPTAPRRTRPSSEADGVVPCMVTTSFCPTS